MIWGNQQSKSTVRTLSCEKEPPLVQMSFSE